jgi:hypothetical protein
MFDLGPIEINAEKSHIVEWTSVAGIIIMASGVVVIELEKKARI